MNAPTPTLEAPPEPTSESTKWRMPPGLKHSLPFYSFKPWVKLGHPIRLFEHLLKTYGNIAHYRFLGTPIVFINDPEYIREILVNQSSSFVKERTVHRMKVLLGEGLITSDDPIHKRQRRIVAPAFHRQRIAAYGDQIVACADSQQKSWRPNQQIDIAAASMQLSLEIVARTLFNTEVTADIRSINDEVNTIMGLYNFIVAFPRLENFIHLPIPKLIKFRKSKVPPRRHRQPPHPRTPRSSSERRARQGRPPLHAPHLTRRAGRRLRPSHRHVRRAGPRRGPHHLSRRLRNRSQRPHLDLVPPQSESRRRSQTPRRTRHRARHRIFVPTESGCPMSGTSDMGSRTGTAARSRLPTLADYPALRYTEQVFAESMRLYPPAWAMGRMSTRPVQLGPYRIPPGAHFFFSQYIMGRDPQYFPDPLRFDPDRFSPEARAARPKFTYFPFGGGNRQCIGESFAWMEGVFSIATIAQRWRMSYLGTTPPVPQAKITLRPRDPLMMQLVPR